MKYTLLITQRCNLACAYCYIGQRHATMSLDVARSVIDFVFESTPDEEHLEIGLFGGEPLIAFSRIREILDLVEAHDLYTPERVTVALVSNGTIFNFRIADFIRRRGIGLVISCDGPPEIHDRFRRFHDGRGTGERVARTVRSAVDLGLMPTVNAVYGPETLEALPGTVLYLSSLGVRQIHINPDFGAPWSEYDLRNLGHIYGALGQLYCDWYRSGDPHFVGPIDTKICALLRGGYHPLERCRMGRGEFAFTPEGNIYPCERLVGNGLDGHCIGNVFDGIQVDRMACRTAPGDSCAQACPTCELRDYCMHWCGCSNYMATGFYDRVSPFLCASEQTWMRVALKAFEEVNERVSGAFYDHLSGQPRAGSLAAARRSRIRRSKAPLATANDP